MGTNCAPLVADLFLFCYERDFMLSLSGNNQADVVETSNSTSRYLVEFLYIDNPYFAQKVSQIYPTEHQLNRANSSDTEAPFLDSDWSITNSTVSTKIYDKQDFDIEIVNFPFLDGDVPRSPSYGVYISQMMHGQIRDLSCEPNIYVSWSKSEIKVRLARHETGLNHPVKYFYWPFQGGTSFVDHLYYLCLVFVMFPRLFIAALWSPEGRGQTSWHLL